MRIVPRERALLRALVSGPGGTAVDDVKVALHIFLIVLIMGTLWRVGTFHLLACKDSRLQHLGKGMSIQY